MRNNLQIIGISLMIVGMVIAIIGNGLFANLTCYCPMQIQGKPSTCHCGEPESMSGHILIYSGIAITLSGIIIFLIQLKKKV